ncbi:MAG TPA: hypothetical protein VN945_06235 [Gemmatimonadales bacterium]|nr:hypothetical protein [Gemmatimonadales bacterium]
MPSAAALIAIIAWANIAVAALWGWGDLLAYLPWVLHRAAGAGAVLTVPAEHERFGAVRHRCRCVAAELVYPRRSRPRLGPRACGPVA